MKSLVLSVFILVVNAAVAQTDCFFLTENFTGTCETLFPDGTPKITAELVDGKRQGMMNLYYPNGLTRSTAYFDNDTVVRSVSYVYQANDMIKWVIADNGTTIMAILYDENRVELQRGELSKDLKPIGEWIFKDAEGNVIKTVNMDDANADKSLFVQPPAAARIPELRVAQPK